ncbi:aldehyde dehydrogenase family protein [Williamsia sterculiae]|uniref:Aldehyde dehydrogenase family protein n=1 Tax=Williamsia sterculiae TaxID=1344003 RepID=A0A1N7EYY2_9NOCA|nr:aldehyde dehydrogenase family protein [Williamsia sterculiae]SIR93281.1 Aldehyde dehydrogenase family protein [Williamsia sterculiae]
MSVDTVVVPDTAQLDEAIEQVTAGAARWAAMDLHARAELLRQTQRAVAAEAPVWAGAATAAKQVPSGRYEGEEWISGPGAVAPMLGEYAATLEKLANGGSALDGVPVTESEDGRVGVQIMPGDLKDRVLFSGYTGHVWLKRGVTIDQARADAGLAARTAGASGGVGLVLGAGNITAIAPLDVAYELVAHNRASILKLNPTLAKLLPSYQRALAPLARAGLVRIVNGGAEVGTYLAEHPGIGHVHITGSARTHDAIVWGTGSAADANRAAGTPKLHKDITSELGGVSPIIVVPGRWSKRDLRYQAENVVTQRLHNAGHNCIGGQSLLVSADWAQKDAFLNEVRTVLSEIPGRLPWYPNGQASIDRAKATYPDAEQVGSCLLVRVREGSPTELFDGEYFATVLGITELPGKGSTFLANAVDFANDQLDGTLGASVIVDPREAKRMGRQFDELIAKLRYGAVGVNVWSGIAFLLGAASWGAFPGHTLEKVGSGIGVVHNTHLLADTEQTIIRGPFRPFPHSILGGEPSLAPRPPWFVTARTARQTGQALARLGGKRSWLNTIRVVPPAMRG